MTDVVAALGLVQLKRYPVLLEKRRAVLEQYASKLALKLTPSKVEILGHYTATGDSSGHLCLVRLIGKDEDFRNRFIECMAAREVACNVHYKPLPLLTAYKALGFSIDDYPHALAQYKNEVTLPLHTRLCPEEIDYIIAAFEASYQECV
jgi:dTDP-4-amino-4,6-dideoxygalactose transaminase